MLNQWDISPRLFHEWALAVINQRQKDGNLKRYKIAVEFDFKVVTNIAHGQILGFNVRNDNGVQKNPSGSNYRHFDSSDEDFEGDVQYVDMAQIFKNREYLKVIVIIKVFDLKTVILIA